MTELLTIQQVSEKFGVTRDTLRTWIKLGRISCIRLGERSIRFDEAEISRFLSRSTSRADIDAAREREAEEMVEKREEFFNGDARNRNEETPAMLEHN